MGDRFGKYRVIAWGCVASAFTTIACALSPTFPMLLLTRSLAGATAAAIIPLSMAWIGDVISYDRRQIALARFMIGFIFGVSAGVFVGGFAADHLNWQVPFLGISAIFLTIGVVLLGIEKRLPSAARETRRGHGPAVARMVSEFSQVMAIPWARVVLATVFAEGAFYYGAFAFLVSHLHLGVAQK
jgi:MFS family permease